VVSARGRGRSPPGFLMPALEPAAALRVKAFLAGHHVLTLATVDADGPAAAALFYAVAGAGSLYVLSDPETQHGRALARDDRVAATIQAETMDWTAITGLQLRGTAHLLAEDDEARRLYFLRFPFAAALMGAGAPHRFYRIAARWVRLIDNSRGLGFKEEFRLD
jgi:uncharacterized protein YhbP (UPF0306 family)